MSEISRKDFLGLGTAATVGLAAGCAPAGGGASITPDLVVINGNVLTQDDANPTAEAFAVVEGRLVAVGSSSDVRNLASVDTEVILVILAEDPHDVDPDSIKEIQVVRTVVGGKTVYGA